MLELKYEIASKGAEYILRRLGRIEAFAALLENFTPSPEAPLPFEMPSTAGADLAMTGETKIDFPDGSEFSVLVDEVEITDLDLTTPGFSELTHSEKRVAVREFIDGLKEGAKFNSRESNQWDRMDNVNQALGAEVFLVRSRGKSPETEFRGFSRSSYDLKTDNIVVNDTLSWHEPVYDPDTKGAKPTGEREMLAMVDGVKTDPKTGELVLDLSVEWSAGYKKIRDMARIERPVKLLVKHGVQRKKWVHEQARDIFSKSPAACLVSLSSTKKPARTKNASAQQPGMAA